MFFAKRTILLITSFILFSLSTALLIQSGLPERATFTGQPLPDGEWVAPEKSAIAPLFSSTTLTGEVFNLHDLRGSLVILNFWATWCEPCLIEMPQLQELSEDADTKDIEIIAVNLGETPEIIADWVEQMGLTFTIVLDLDYHIQTSYQLRGQPSTYIIAPDGTIRDLFYGPVSARVLESAVKELEKS